jgi:hypothetical protein
MIKNDLIITERGRLSRSLFSTITQLSYFNEERNKHEV